MMRTTEPVAAAPPRPKSGKHRGKNGRPPRSGTGRPPTAVREVAMFRRERALLLGALLKIEKGDFTVLIGVSNNPRDHTSTFPLTASTINNIVRLNQRK